jgi:hypothetical protein
MSPTCATTIQRTLVENNQNWENNIELVVSYTGDQFKKHRNYIRHLTSDVPYNPHVPMAQITNSIWLEDAGL